MEYNYPATITPGYQSQRKLDPLKDVSFPFASNKFNTALIPDIVTKTSKQGAFSDRKTKSRTF